MEGAVMANVFTYSITDDTLNGKVSLKKLTGEIRDSAIVIALQGVVVSEDTITVTFKADLPGDNIAIINGLISAHDGEDVEIQPPTSPDGVPLVSITQAYTRGEYPRWRYFGFTALAGQKTFMDIEVTEEVNLARGEIRFWEDMQKLIHKNSRLSFSMIDKNDAYQPGLFAMLGLTVGQDILELDTPVIDNKIRPDGINYAPSLGFLPVKAGLTFRVEVDNTGEYDIDTDVYIEWYVKKG
jgi:hypothetical protein